MALTPDARAAVAIPRLLPSPAVRGPTENDDRPEAAVAEGFASLPVNDLADDDDIGPNRAHHHGCQLADEPQMGRITASPVGNPIGVVDRRGCRGRGRRRTAVPLKQ